MLDPLVNPQDFPFVVIEYFRDDIVDRPTDQELRICSGMKVGHLQKLFNNTTGQFTTSSVEIDNEDNRVFNKRWDMVEFIAVIAPARMQTYYCVSLDNPHYSVHPIEFKSYRRHLSMYQKKNKGVPEFFFVKPVKITRSNNVCG